MAYTEILLFL